MLDVVAREDNSLPRALSQRDPTASLAAVNIRSAPEARRPPWSLLRERLGSGAFHLIAMRHVIDDIAQAAVAEHEGIGIARSDPEAQQAVMRALRAYWRSGELEHIVVPRLLDIVDACAAALHPQGRLLFTHEVLDLDLRQGHPLELYADYIPLARRWLAEAVLPLHELSLDGFEPHWWLCLQRIGGA